MHISEWDLQNLRAHPTSLPRLVVALYVLDNHIYLEVTFKFASLPCLFHFGISLKHSKQVEEELR